MANVIKYNPTDPIVPNRVTRYLMSVNTPEYQSGNYLINPNLTKVATVNRKYWKVDRGNVVEMSTSEKEAIDNDIDEKIIRAERDAEIQANKYWRMRQHIRRKAIEWSLTPADVRNFYQDLLGDKRNIKELYIHGYTLGLQNFIDSYDSTNPKFTQAIQNELIGILTG